MIPSPTKTVSLRSLDFFHNPVVTTIGMGGGVLYNGIVAGAVRRFRNQTNLNGLKALCNWRRVMISSPYFFADGEKCRLAPELRCEDVGLVLGFSCENIEEARRRRGEHQLELVALEELGEIGCLDVAALVVVVERFSEGVDGPSDVLGIVDVTVEIERTERHAPRCSVGVLALRLKAA